MPLSASDFPVVWQRNPLWSRNLLGKSSTSTFGDYACLLCCFTSAARQRDPRPMNACRIATGGYQNEPRGAWAANFDISACAPSVKLLRITQIYAKPVPPAEMTSLYSHLLDGGIAILELDWRGDAAVASNHGNYQHFVLAVGTRTEYQQPMKPVVNEPYRGMQTVLPLGYGSTPERAIWRIFYQAVIT